MPSTLDIIDFLLNIPQGLDVLKEWFKAQEGLKYNLYTFKLTIEKAGDKGSSAASPGEPAGQKTQSVAAQRKDKGSSLASPRKPAAQETQSGAAQGNTSQATTEGPRLQILSLQASLPGIPIVNPWSIKPGPGGPSVAIADFGLVSYLVDPATIICSVVLEGSIGFDSAVFNQAEVEFSGQDIGDGKGHILVFKGFVNRFGLGFGHFWGSLKVQTQWEKYSKVTPIIAEVVPAREGRVKATSHGFTLRF